jgi:membrane fusion protein (multidrug efflux system)
MSQHLVIAGIPGILHRTIAPDLKESTFKEAQRASSGVRHKVSETMPREIERQAGPTVRQEEPSVRQAEPVTREFEPALRETEPTLRETEPAKPDDVKAQPTGTPVEPEKKQKNKLKTGLIIGAALLALTGAAVGGFKWYDYATAHEETDDSYTTAHMHAISSRINDTVSRVLVDDNEHVKEGQVLVLLDPGDYQVRVQSALAALKVAQHQAEAAQSSIKLSSTNATGKTTEATGNVSNAISMISKSQAAVLEAKSAIPQTQAVLAEKRADQERAEKDYTRFQKLAEQGAVSWQQRDQALRDFDVAKNATVAAQEDVKQAAAKLEQADQAVIAARAQLVQSQGVAQQAEAMHVQTQVDTSQYDVAKATIAQAQAQLNDAELQLSYTKITSPVTGRIGKKSVEAGQRVQPGQQLMSVVADDLWVVANFKETQLERIRKGEHVSVKIDSFPHHEFSGVVDSVSPGSGASFALLPPDNATGNFTKIVQRVPVKVTFDRASIKGFEDLLVPGMSAVVSIAVK